MDSQLIDIPKEEPTESDSMIDDYMKGLNEGIGKLLDKESDNTNKENKTKLQKVSTTNGSNKQKSDLVLLLDDEIRHGVDNEEIGNNASDLQTSNDLNRERSGTESGSKTKGRTNNESKRGRKEEIGAFIENIDEVNKIIDKLVSNEEKRTYKRNTKEIRKCGMTDALSERNVEKDSRENQKKSVKDMGTGGIDSTNTALDKTNLSNDKLQTELPSNLTVLEQTYTLEQYHKRYEQKCEKEKKTLEELVLDEKDIHGVHECNAELHEDQYNSVPYEYQNYMGMTVTSGIVTIPKDSSNLIGISIGGGAPLCPCLYIVQVFDNTPASKEGTLQSGDEVVGVNGACVKGKTKVEVAKMIQSVESEVSIKYNKLHADPQQGKSLDIVLKKVKHRLVENMSTTTADALGLSRAILCNDTLVKKMEELENTEQMYKGLVDHSKKVLKGFLALLRVYKDFGDSFAGIGVREPQPRASEAFRQFGEYHRQMEKNGIATIKAVKPILSDLGTYLNKAIPDTKLTIRKYADTKFEYLSYCLKVKEMDDEEYSYAALQEPLYRVETGNYEYRLILRCRQDARLRFAALRSDVLVKLELLDNKHVQDVVCQLQRFIAGLASYHSTNIGLLRENSLFPIEMDLSRSSFQYECSQVPNYENNNDEDQGEGDEDLIIGEEAKADEGQEEREEEKTGGYGDLLKELEEPTTNLLDL